MFFYNNLLQNRYYPLYICNVDNISKEKSSCLHFDSSNNTNPNKVPAEMLVPYLFFLRYS